MEVALYGSPRRQGRGGAGNTTGPSESLESYEDLVSKANEIVKSCELKSVGRTIQRMRLGKAKELYKEAFRKDLPEEERAKAARYLFETDAKLCDLYLDLDSSYFKQEMLQASHYANMAIRMTERFSTDWTAWKEEVHDGFLKFVGKFIQVMRAEEYDDEFETRYPGIVTEIAPKCSQSPEMVVDLYSALIDRFLYISYGKRETCHADEDFHKLANLHTMCYRYVDDVMAVLETRPDQPNVQFGDWERFKKKVLGEMSDRKEKVNIEQRSIVAAKAFSDGFLRMQRTTQLTIEEDGWTAIIDSYLRGLSEIRDHEKEYRPDLEDPVYVNNAAAGRGYKLIGDLYSKLLTAANANVYYQKAVKYGQKAHLSGETKWFDEAQKLVDKFKHFQKEDGTVRQNEEDRQHRQLHAEKLEQIRGLTPRKTLPKIYELFPPKGRFENMEIPDFSTMNADNDWRKAYGKAMKVYNPDNVRENPEWKAICGDILTVINRKYDEMTLALQ